MADAPTTHYLNSDFDLSLRPRPRQLESSRLARQVRELSLQALIGVDAGESAMVRTDPPSEFLDYLVRCGLPLPRVVRHPRVDPAARLRPFGWSAEAIELNRLCDEPVDHPALPVVRRVNSRSFAVKLGAELADEGPLGALVENVGELDALLARAPADSEWVIKAEHGNAGLANRRLGRLPLSAAERRFAEERFAEDDRLVVEPWLSRERDWCVVFEVPFDRSSLRVHETVCTRDGALIGARFVPRDRGLDPWPEELALTAERVGSRLESEGYFGPVCVDAFSWRDGDRSRLRPLVDLNCRLSMSDGAHRLWRRSAPDRELYYRFFNRRKLVLPTEFPPALAALGEHAYDPSARRGVLLASPLELSKLAVVFVADERRGIDELEQWFRGRFEG